MCNSYIRSMFFSYWKFTMKKSSFCSLLFNLLMVKNLYFSKQNLYVLQNSCELNEIDLDFREYQYTV